MDYVKHIDVANHHTKTIRIYEILFQSKDLTEKKIRFVICPLQNTVSKIAIYKDIKAIYVVIYYVVI